MRFWWTTMGYAQLRRRTITRFFWLETIKGRLAAVNMTTATAQTFVRRRNAVNCRQRQDSSRELIAEDVVSTSLSLSDAKRSEALTKSCHESFKKHCTRQLTSRNRNQKRSSLDHRWFCLSQWIRACAVRHSLAMTHVWHYKFNIATKTTQICDQPKECEESGRKCLYMLGSRATKLVTAPWRIGRLSVLRTLKGHVCTIQWNHAKLIKSNQVILKAT